MAALTADAVWIQDTWRLRSVALRGSEIERRAGSKELVLTLGPESFGEKLTLTFDSQAEADRWYGKIQACQSKLVADAPPDAQRVTEGVALVRRAPDVPRVAIGCVAFLHRSPATADRGIQLRAGILGADAIIELQRKKCPEMGRGARQVTGLAIRVQDDDVRKRLRWKWYAEEVSVLTRRMLCLLVIQALLLFLVSAFMAGKTGLTAATGETLSESIVSAGVGLGLVYAWPLVLIVLLGVLRWQELLRPAGFGVLTATTVRGLIVVLAHLLAVFTTGATLAESKIGLLLDPVDWAFIIAGAVICVGAWRLARDASLIVPEEAQVVSRPRKLAARGLLAATGVFALVLFGWAGRARYEESAYLLQKGVDPRREHEALLAMNEGTVHANKGDLEVAEKSFQRSLRIWEALTSKRSAPSVYRMNLALTLNDLGWIRLRKARPDEAEKYYSRAVAIADQLKGDPQLDENAKQVLAEAREVLADLRTENSGKLLDEKDNEAARKYEEAQVTEEKDELKAESIFREAIATWEEILPQATGKDYRKSAVARLARAYLQLGGLQGQLGKHSDSEASLKKSIDYGERAVTLDPARALAKHNLEVARRMLDRLHEQAFQDEIDKLNRAGRFADAIDLFARSIKEQEERVDAGKGLDTAVPSLASRLSRFASFLAHCPDKRLRDTKAAVGYARKATSLRSDVGDYWYTLAMVQYRNGDWRDSLASLETLKARQGELDASDWLLTAMNLHRLKRKEEARSAVATALQWMEERSRKAEGDALQRLEYEMMRPTVEALLREAQNLINGDPVASQKDA